MRRVFRDWDISDQVKGASPRCFNTTQPRKREKPIIHLMIKFHGGSSGHSPIKGQLNDENDHPGSNSLVVPRILDPYAGPLEYPSACPFGCPFEGLHEGLHEDQRTLRGDIYYCYH